jgi:hypothetical protein
VAFEHAFEHDERAQSREKPVQPRDEQNLELATLGPVDWFQPVAQ